MAFPSIVIPSLTGTSKELNPDETLRVTASQASWLASSVFIGQPFGSIFSAFLTDGLGRRKTMLLVNIPNLTAWLLLANTKSLTLVYLAFILFGISAGLFEGPIMTYLGMDNLTAIFLVSNSINLFFFLNFVDLYRYNGTF